MADNEQEGTELVELEESQAQKNEIHNSIEENTDMKLMKSMRKGFIRKVYSIFLCQIAMAVLFIYFSTFPIIRQYIINLKFNLFVSIINLIILLITAILIILSHKIKNLRKYNYLFIFIFTLCFCIVTAFLTSFFETKLILFFGILIVAVTFSITLYVCHSQTDYNTHCGGCLICSLSVFSIMSIILGLVFYKLCRIPLVKIIYCVIGIIIYLIYLIYETHTISGKFKKFYDIDEYPLAAISIYFGVFHFILSPLNYFTR